MEGRYGEARAVSNRPRPEWDGWGEWDEWRCNNGLDLQNHGLYAPRQFMERTRGEIILFAAAIFGIWLSIWAVIFVSKWLEASALVITLGALSGFALRDES